MKLKKCIFAVKECTYLGHLVGKGRVKTEEKKIRAIKKME